MGSTGTATAPAAGVSTTSVSTGDEFNGGQLDPNIWVVGTSARWCDPAAAWKVVATEPCAGVTQAPPYGSISVADGTARFSAGAETRAFPYVWSRDGLIPASGDFVVEIRLRYESLKNHGDGLSVRLWSDPTPASGNSPFDDSGGKRCAGFGLWGDSALGQPRTGITGLGVDVPGGSLDFHNYRFQYAGGRFFLFIDGVLAQGPVKSAIRPDRIWLGNPVFTYWGVADWSDFSIDYVRVSQPVLIDGDGNGVHDARQTWTPVNVPSSALQDSDLDGLPDHCDPTPIVAPPPSTVPELQLFGASPGIHAVNPSGTMADPVNSGTGSFVESVTDVALPGVGVPFSLARTYTSADSAEGSLGRGWRHPYAASLNIAANGDAILRGEDGQGVRFTRQADGSFLSDPGGLSSLSAVSGGYEVVRIDQVRYGFDSGGRLTSIRDRNGHGLVLAYGTDDLLASVTDSASRRVVFTHDAGGRLTAIALPDGRTVSYGYSEGLLTSVTDVRGGITRYEYDPAGRLIREIDANGNAAITNVYGSDSRVAEQIDALGNRTTFAWDPASETLTATEPRGNVWRDVYSNNRLVKRIDPLGNSTTYEYDADLNRIAVTDARGNTTRMGYDLRGNLICVTSPAPFSYEKTYTYDAQNNLASTTDGRGNVTTYAYDLGGNLLRVTEPGAAVTEYGHDPATGLISTITDPSRRTTWVAHDLSGNVVREESPLGAVTTMSYDAGGRLVRLVEPRGNEAGALPSDFETVYVPDAAGNLLREIDPLGNATSYAYDPIGNLIERTDAKGRTTRYGYDAANRLLSVTAPDGTVTRYAYDGVGNRTSRTDANGHTTHYVYDVANRLTEVISPLGRRWTYSYNEEGYLSLAVNAAGNATSDPGDGVTRYGYDALNRLAAIDYSDATPDVSYAYDANDNRVRMEDGVGAEAYVYDERDRLVSLTRGTDGFGYAYDASSQLVRRTYPDGAAFTYAYDAEGRLSSMTSGTSTTSYAYDISDNVVRATLPASNGFVEGRSYDRAGRLVEVRHSNSSRTISYAHYTLDAVGNPIAVETKPDDGEPSETDGNQHTTTYRYDELDRLVEVCFKLNCTATSDPFIRWSYDALGNRLTENRTAGMTLYAYDADDQLVSLTGPSGEVPYDYDANGNQVRAGNKTFGYDLANRVVSATVGGVTTGYTYDGDGKRFSAGSTRFLWDTTHPVPQVALERRASGSTLRYSYGAGLVGMTSGGDDFYFHADGLGSILNITSSTGRVERSYGYEPFGTIRREIRHGTNVPENAFGFAGEYLDGETGLYHLRARQYDAATGRFLATDPLPSPAGSPCTASYVYAGNRPTVFADPSGLGAVLALNQVTPAGLLANGCGPNDWRARWIPDKVLGVFDFKDACNWHDDCYGRPGANKDDCDDGFRNRMARSCLKTLRPFECLVAAGAYYGAVKLHGQKAFRNAQCGAGVTRYCPKKKPKTANAI